MATLSDFYHGARPKTLSAAVAPVAIGAALAYAVSRSSEFENSRNFNLGVTLMCLVVAVALQVGVNYANDYSDGKKGTDDNRVGPMRLVGSGRASERSVLIAMSVSFFIAGIAGIYVASQSSWWLILVGAACIALAWFYTGGKHPYGYIGLGELAVFVCFGQVATVGTFYANTHIFTYEAMIAGCIPGLYSVAILLANNIRDIQTDRQSGKKTFATRVGERNACHIFAGAFILIACAILGLGFSFPLVFLVLLVMAFDFHLVRKMYAARMPPQFISILVETSRANLASAMLIAALLFLGAA
ncbi:MAG TPA: 1,4-dihydroxy-2-naphthoate polyprenyltransferase [Acidimicrobiia bacterium]|nr:1,4-dihydroxy-2-naphthoate polyprenyltransferase [Acidimicrobiia bacterium]